MQFRTHIKNGKDLLQLSIPMSLSAASGVLTVTIDSIMLGQISITHLGAIAVSSSIFIVFEVFMRGITSALPPLITRHINTKNLQKRDQYIYHSVILLLLVLLFLIPILLIFSANLQKFGQPLDIAILSNNYLSIMSIGLIPLGLLQIFRGAIESHNNSKIPMFATYAGAITNIIGNWLLIFGTTFTPALGVQGAAISSVIGHILTMVIMIIYLIKKYDCKFLEFVSEKINWTIIRELFSIGLPFGMQWLIEVTAFSFTSFMLGTYNKIDLAAHQIVLNIASFMFMLPLGMSTACTIKVSQSLTSDTRKNSNIYIYSCLISCWTISLATASFLLISRYWIPSLYTNNIDVINLASQLFLIAAFFQAADGTQTVAAGILRALLDIKIPTIIISVVWWGITMPLCYILALKLNWGATGMWVGLTSGLFMAGSLLTLRIRSIINANGE